MAIVIHLFLASSGGSTYTLNPVKWNLQQETSRFHFFVLAEEQVDIQNNGYNTKPRRKNKRK